MKEILRKLTELVETCETKIRKVEAERINLANALRETNDLTNSLIAKKKDLDEREARVSESEKIASTIKEANDYLNSAKQELALAKSKNEEFAKKVAEWEKKKSEEEATLVKAREKLSSAQKALDEERASYKVKVIEAVHREEKVKKGK